MNRLYKNLVSFLGFRNSIPTPKRRGRPAGSGNRSTPRLVKFVQLPNGQLVRKGKGRPSKSTIVVQKTEADAAAHNASLVTIAAA